MYAVRVGVGVHDSLYEAVETSSGPVLSNHAYTYSQYRSVVGIGSDRTSDISAHAKGGRLGRYQRLSNIEAIHLLARYLGSTDKMLYVHWIGLSQTLISAALV